MKPLCVDLFCGLGGWSSGFLAAGYDCIGLRRNEAGDFTPMGHNRPGKARDGLKFGGGWWHDSTNNLIRKASSRSAARKAASAMIAKIPGPLAAHIAETYRPARGVEAPRQGFVSGGKG